MSDRAIMFAAPSSGSGKTLITCGVLQALKNRGLKIASFKCGPDYIDPMFHRRVIGVEASNIDLFFCDDDTARCLFEENSRGSDISVIEGVMGYYDGMSAASLKASSYDVSRTLGIPVILIINAKGQSLSSMAVLKGMSEFRADSNIAGVIFNNMSKHVYCEIKEEVEKTFNIKALGYLPKVNDLTIESRHLGLVTPGEIEELTCKLNKLAQIIEETVDMDELIGLACRYRHKAAKSLPVERTEEKPVIAVARDEAFCFYYKDNLNILKKMGAVIREFSPIHDEAMPPDADALILGGGYPELYCREIFGNLTMINSIKEAIDRKIPCLAECGGFMFLHDCMEDMEGLSHSGLGIIEGKAYRTDRLNRFGYITLTANSDSWLMKKGEQIKAHEFHYFDSENCGNEFTAVKPVTQKSWQCINIKDNVAAGFPHLFYCSNMSVPQNLIRAALEYRKSRKEK